MTSYMSVCKRYVDIQYHKYFQINLAFICFILPLQMSLNVLQYLNNYEASNQTRRTTTPSKQVGRDAVLYVLQYMFR